jgi:hypothetical protein
VVVYAKHNGGRKTGGKFSVIFSCSGFGAGSKGMGIYYQKIDYMEYSS